MFGGTVSGADRCCSISRIWLIFTRQVVCWGLSSGLEGGKTHMGLDCREFFIPVVGALRLWDDAWANLAVTFLSGNQEWCVQ